MACEKHVLFLTWHQHHWRRGVSWAETFSSRETNMWGRPTEHLSVTCQTHYYCTECGKTKREAFCGCDKEKADRCTIHRAWADSATPHDQVSA